MEDSQRYYSGHKKRHLIKILSIVSTTGIFVCPYKGFWGKMTDNQILISIFERKVPHYFEFLEMIANAPTIFILDRGFRNFISFLKEKQSQDPHFFPNLKCVQPCVSRDKESNQYTEKEINESRANVTSIRGVVGFG